MTDLAETIAKWRAMMATDTDPTDPAAIELARILDAAERALALDSVGFTPSTPDIAAARDAALEEAAAMVEQCADDSVMAEDELREAAVFIRSRKGAA